MDTNLKNKLLFVASLLVLAVLVIAIIVGYRLKPQITKTVVSVAETNVDAKKPLILRTGYSENEDYFYFNNESFIVSGFIPSSWQIEYTPPVNGSDSVYSSITLKKDEYKINIIPFGGGMGCIFPDSLKYNKPSNPKFPYEGKTKMQYQLKSIYDKTLRIEESTKQENQLISGVCLSETGNPNTYTSTSMSIVTPEKQDQKTMTEIRGVIERLLVMSNDAK